MTINSPQHWDNIYKEKAGTELGWFEQDVNQTLKFLAHCPLKQPSYIFLPGAGTSLLVDALDNHGNHLILNDLSEQALLQLEARVGTENKSYFIQDISKPFVLPYKVTLWIDRAVLHFLLSETEINQYFNNLRQTLDKGGYVLLAQFSTTGAKKCAGLPLHQYSLNEMQKRLGNEFQLITHEEYIFMNPFGEPRPYLYALFKRQK